VRILRPDMAAWLLAIPVVIACWILHYQYKWRQRRRAISGALRRGAAPAASEGSRRSRRTTAIRDFAVLGLSVLTVGLLTTAMMRPQVRWERRTPTFERRDLVLILDRSVSMRARDVAPSRFARAVEEIQTFLRRKPDAIDRVALVGFAAASVVLSYPTDDLGSLFFYLDWVRDDPTPLFGTDIGAALTSALSVVRRDPQRLLPLFVLISDGDDEGEELVRAIGEVKRAGIRVNCVGVGASDDVPLPVPAGGGREEFMRDQSGRVLTTRFDEATLQRIASATGGRYFRSVTGGELTSALDSIALEERRQVGSTTSVDYRDLYLVLLAAAVVISAQLVALL
jgi:Ca-activated chloride channel homolog